MEGPLRSPIPRRARAARVAVALSSLAALGAALDPEDEGRLPRLAPPVPVDPALPAALAEADTIRCGFCHEEILREWASTLHALAWVDPRYRAALEGRRKPASCHGCHAPEPLHRAPAAGTPAADELVSAGGRPPARDGAREPRSHGVSCRTCHVSSDGAVLGPLGIETDAHAGRRSESFVSASDALCAACHRTTVGPVIGVSQDFDAERMADQGLSCVGCHMQPVLRPTATDDDERPTPPRAGRSHALQTPRDPAFLAQAFALSAERRGRAVVVVVEGRAGHRVPALEGRELRLLLEGVRGGEPVGRREHALTTRAPLSARGRLELELPAAGEDAGAGLPVERVRVRGTHLLGDAEPVVFLDVELALEEER